MKKEMQEQKTAEKDGGEGGEPSRCRSASMRAESERKRRKEKKE